MKPLFIEQSLAVMAGSRKSIKHDHASFGISPFSARIYEVMFGLNEVPVAAPGELDGLFDHILSEVLTWVDDPAQIRLVVHVHTGPTVGLPGALVLPASLRRAGIHDAICFGVCCNRCVSFFNGLDIARHYLSHERAGARALVISGEAACTQELRLVPNVAVAGDGIGAMLVNLNGPGDRVLSCEISSDGKFARGVWLEGGLRSSYENNYRSMLLNVVQRALDNAGSRLDEISWLLPHNTSASAWRFWAQSAGFPVERLFLENIPRTGHCFGTDLINNHAALRAGAYSASGDRYLMAAAGLGGMFGAAVLERARENLQLSGEVDAA